MSLSVLIDNREPLQLALAVEAYGYEVEFTCLHAGDFQGSTTIGEIKRGDDFFNSIVDGRLVRQAQKMANTGKVGYLILAGNMADVRHRLEPVVRTLVNLVFHYRLFIIPVMNVEVTIAYAIHRILTDIDAKKSLSIDLFPNKLPLPSGKKIISLDMLQSIPGIGSRGASEILHSKYSTLDKLLEATPPEIALIPKIGMIKAISIYNAIRRTDSS